MGASVSGWMNEYVDGWVGGQVSREMSACMKKWMHE